MLHKRSHIKDGLLNLTRNLTEYVIYCTYYICILYIKHNVLIFYEKVNFLALLFSVTYIVYVNVQTILIHYQVLIIVIISYYIPCYFQLYQQDINNFGEKNYPLPPSCLISVYASPDAVPTLHYSVPLVGVADPVTLWIHRSLRTTSNR